MPQNKIVLAMFDMNVEEAVGTDVLPHLGSDVVVSSGGNLPELLAEKPSLLVIFMRQTHAREIAAVQLAAAQKEASRTLYVIVAHMINGDWHNLSRLHRDAPFKAFQIINVGNALGSLWNLFPDLSDAQRVCDVRLSDVANLIKRIAERVNQHAGSMPRPYASAD